MTAVGGKLPPAKRLTKDRRVDEAGIDVRVQVRPLGAQKSRTYPAFRANSSLSGA